MFKVVTFIILLLIVLPIKSIAEEANGLKCFPRNEIISKFQKNRFLLIQRGAVENKLDIIMEIYAKPKGIKRGKRIYSNWILVFVKKPSMLTCIMSSGPLLVDTNPFGLMINY